jgi:HK97 family phage portal protein
MSLLSRAKSLLGFEGSARGPFSGMGELGGFYGVESLGDGWQRNLEVDSFSARRVPAVYACVMAISRAVSQCYPRHVRNVDGVHEDVRTSAAYRVLRNPNAYQASPDFFLNLVATALFDGEAFAVATRNDRYEINSLHLLPRGACSVRVSEDSKDIFYSIGSSPLAPGGVDYIAPARDVLHLRFHTPRHPLIGESPIRAAAMAIGVNVALSQNQAAFFSRMNRPSGILSTDQALNAEQSARLRAAFDEQSKKWAAGGMPILGGGLKFQPLSINSQDAQLVEAQRMSLEDICRVFGVPPPLVGDLSHATLNNSETLIQHFLSMSLGSYLEHIERSLDRLFGLSNNEYVELDTAALLRTDFAGRVDGLTKAVQGGLMTPDEARAREGLSPIKGGDVAYLQRQMVPVDKIGDLLEAETAAKTQPAPAAAPPVQEEPPEEPEDEPQEAKGLDVGIAKALLTAYMVNKTNA